MEHNDQVMQEWKQELGELKLSKERIIQIEEAIYESPKRRWSPVKIVMPFAIAIVLLLVFAGMPQNELMTANNEKSLLTIQPLSGLLIGWGAVANVFVVTNYLLMIAVVQKVPRIQHMGIFEAFKRRMNKRQIWQLVVVTLFFAAFGWAIVLLLPFGLLAVQLYIGILFIPFVTLIQLLLTRTDEWPVCAHCGELVSKKTMAKRTWGETPKCDSCDKPLYENSKVRNKALRINFFAPFIIILPQLTQSVHIVALIFYVFVYLIIMFISMKYIAPYTVEFTDDDKIPPLW